MGTAFGLMGSLESVAFTAFPLIAASIVEASTDKDAGYSRVGFFFTGMSINIQLTIRCPWIPPRSLTLFF